MFDILKWHLDDKTLRDVFYRLDYQQWQFDARTFPLSDDEPAIDHLLFVYDLIGYYAETGVIEEGELPIIGFEASRVLHNTEIIKYLTRQCHTGGLARSLPSTCQPVYQASINSRSMDTER